MLRSLMRNTALGLVIGVSLLGAACSSSSSSPAAPTDAGGTSSDASNGGDDTQADAGTLSQTCGAPPYVTLGITLKALTGSGETPLPGARFTSPLCPDKYQVTDADGKLTGAITKGVTFYGRFEAKNYVKMLTPEQLYEADDPNVTASVPSALFSALIPGYDASKPTIFIGGFKDGGHGACDALDGAQYSVVNHPEVTVTYFSNDAIPQPTASAATTVSGRASITGLNVGEAVTLVGSKSGCEVVFKHGANTGRAPLEAGFITFIGAYVHDAQSDASTD
jgi:hypothetical protein